MQSPSSHTRGERHRAPYDRPRLTAYGTVADLTGHGHYKEWGPGDFFWILRRRHHDEGGYPGGGLS